VKRGAGDLDGPEVPGIFVSDNLYPMGEKVVIVKPVHDAAKVKRKGILAVEDEKSFASHLSAHSGDVWLVIANAEFASYYSDRGFGVSVAVPPLNYELVHCIAELGGKVEETEWLGVLQ